MRCPKCGFISFDHLDFCRKCSKPLGAVAVVLHGSVYDCQVPAFLRFSQLEEAVETMDDVPLLADEIEEVEIEAPDLAISLADSTPVKTVTVNIPSAVPLATATVTAQATSPQPIAAFSEGENGSLSWPQEKEPSVFMVDEKTPSLIPAEMELPPDLADISDLAPPSQTTEFSDGDGDFDLDLDLDLGFDLRDVEEDADFEEMEPASAADSGKREAAPVDMDADLDFELDLGGLSLHDYGDDRH